MQTNKPALRKVRLSEVPLTQAEAEALTIAYIASIFTVDALDGAAKTSLYRQKLKNIGNEFQREPIKTIESAPGVWESEQLDIPELVDYIRKIVTRLAKSPANTVWLMYGLLDSYEEDPEGTLNKLGIKLVNAA